MRESRFRRRRKQDLFKVLHPAPLFLLLGSCESGVEETLGGLDQGEPFLKGDFQLVLSEGFTGGKPNSDLVLSFSSFLRPRNWGDKHLDVVFLQHPFVDLGSASCGTLGDPMLERGPKRIRGLLAQWRLEILPR